MFRGKSFGGITAFLFFSFTGILVFFALRTDGGKKINNNQPNVLFIAVDDLKPSIGCFGDSLAQTPHIDRLAKKGMVFMNMYCQQAVCAPSRASLLTGRYPDQTEVWDLETLIRDRNPDILTLPQYFRQKGYYTAGIGKIFDSRSVDSKQDDVSWTTYGNPYQDKWYDNVTGKPAYYYASEYAKDTIGLLETEAAALGINQRDYVKERYWPSTENADVPYNAYVDGAITNAGLDLLNQVSAGDKSFFLAVGFHRPHLPFNAPREFWELYNRDDFSLAEFQQRAQNSPSLAYHNFGELRSYSDIPASGNLSADKQLELIHAYYAAVSYIDFCFGKLLTRLEELNLAENTIVVLWGDHGWHLGDHNLWCKHSNFEQATRAPLIISYPGQPNPGVTYTYPTEFTDIATTLCGLCNLDIPVEFEGESLIPAFEAPDVKIREGAFSQYPRSSSGTKYMGYSLRTERFRYTKWVNRSSFEHHTTELYDYLNDPLETNNLAGDPAFEDVKNQLDSMVTARIAMPSTQERISFKVKEINAEGDTVNSKGAEVYFLDTTVKTNAEGLAVLTHVPGDYHFDIKKKGFESFTDNFSLTNDTTISVLLKHEYYDVQVKVKADWNNENIEGAFVKLGDTTKITDESGNAGFGAVAFSRYNIRIELPNGWSQTFYQTEIFSDTLLTFYISEPKYTVLLNVSNKYTNQAIELCRVSVNQREISTNFYGNALFEIPEGDYQVTIQHKKYSTLQDSVKINSDTILNYALSPAFSDIKFRIKENSTPINEAVVEIEGTAIASNSIGISRFYNLAAFSEYTYSVEKETYKRLTGSLFLVNDTTIELQMEKISTNIEKHNLSSLSIWPNPFTSKLFIENQLDKRMLIRVFDSTGKTIENLALEPKEKTTWPADKLSTGHYYISVLSEKEISFYNLIKKK